MKNLFNRRFWFWAPGVLGVLNLLLANGNIWMMIGGVAMIFIQVLDVYEKK